MTTTRIAIASALAAALVLPAAAQAQGNMEKCFGVAKAGKNDCQTAKSSCAGTSKSGCPDRRLDLGPQGRLREDRRRQARRRLTPWIQVAGIGLRAPHLAEIARERPATGFLEIHAENYLAASPALQAVEAPAGRLCVFRPCRRPVAGLGRRARRSASGARCRLVKRLEPALVSDHLSWSTIGGRYFNDLLPLPYTEEALDVVVRNVQRLQEALGRQVSIENPSCYLGFAQSTLTRARVPGASWSGAAAAACCSTSTTSPSTAHNLRLDPRDWLGLPG